MVTGLNHLVNWFNVNNITNDILTEINGKAPNYSSKINYGGGGGAGGIVRWNAWENSRRGDPFYTTISGYGNFGGGNGGSPGVEDVANSVSHPVSGAYGSGGGGGSYYWNYNEMAGSHINNNVMRNGTSGGSGVVFVTF